MISIKDTWMYIASAAETKKHNAYIYRLFAHYKFTMKF